MPSLWPWGRLPLSRCEPGFLLPWASGESASRPWERLDVQAQGWDPEPGSLSPQCVQRQEPVGTEQDFRGQLGMVSGADHHLASQVLPTDELAEPKKSHRQSHRKKVLPEIYLTRLLSTKVSPAPRPCPRGAGTPAGRLGRSELFPMGPDGLLGERPLGFGVLLRRVYSQPQKVPTGNFCISHRNRAAGAQGSGMSRGSQLGAESAPYSPPPALPTAPCPQDLHWSLEHPWEVAYTNPQMRKPRPKDIRWPDATWLLHSPPRAPQAPWHYPRCHSPSPSSPELTATRSLQGTLQKFLDDLFKAILSIREDKPPLAVKYFFDFLEEQAEKRGISDPDTLHIWKTNRSVVCGQWVGRQGGLCGFIVSLGGCSSTGVQSLVSQTPPFIQSLFCYLAM